MFSLASSKESILYSETRALGLAIRAACVECPAYTIEEFKRTLRFSINAKVIETVESWFFD